MALEGRTMSGTLHSNSLWLEWVRSSTGVPLLSDQLEKEAEGEESPHNHTSLGLQPFKALTAAIEIKKVL